MEVHERRSSESDFVEMRICIPDSLRVREGQLKLYHLKRYMAHNSNAY